MNKKSTFGKFLESVFIFITIGACLMLGAKAVDRFIEDPATKILICNQENIKNISACQSLADLDRLLNMELSRNDY